MKVCRFCTALLVFALMACGQHRYPRQLVVADSLCAANPDSAMELLQQLETQMEDAPLPDRMYYQLLRIKATDKARLPLTSDSLILQLVGYYEHGGDKALLPVAYYYAGRTYRSLNDSPQALGYFQKSLDALPDHDLALRHFVASQMGYLYYIQRLYDDALASFRIAYHCDSLLNDTIGMIYGLRDIAANFNNIEDYEQALAYYNRAIALAESKGVDEMVAGLNAQIANVYSYMNEVELARHRIIKAIAFDDKEDQSAVYSIAAAIYLQAGIDDSVVYCCRKLIALRSIYAKRAGYRELSDYFFKHHQDDSASVYFRLFKVYSDSIDRVTATTAVAQMHALYDYQLREKENARLERENSRQERWLVTIGATVLVLVLLSVLAFIYIRYRNFRLKIRLERRRTMLEELRQNSQEQVEANRKQIQLIEQQLATNAVTSDLEHRMALEKDRLSVQNQLVALRQEEQLLAYSDIKEQPVMKRIAELINDSAIKNKKLSNEEWEELGQIVHRICPDFKKRLVVLVKLTLFKYRVCLLLKVGVSVTDIAKLTNHSKGAVSSVRRRLFTEAFGLNGAPADWDSFILSL